MFQIDLYIELMGEIGMAEMPEIQKKVGEEIFDVLKKEKAGKYASRDEIIAQARILKKLPDNLVQQVYGHLQSEYINRKNFKEKHPEITVDEEDDFINAKGFINEIMANIQIRQTNPDLRGGSNPEIRAQLDNYENKILSFTNNPALFDFDISSSRNPDVAWLDLDEAGSIIIKGVGEITTTHQLNKRKYLQLNDKGFIRTLRWATNFLNNMENGEEHGLPEFGKKKKKIEIAPKIKTYLMVHHDMDTSQEGLANSIGKTVSDIEYTHLTTQERKKVFSQSEKDSFLKLLTSPDTVIIKSAFSNYDCHLITGYIMDKIKKTYPDYQN